MAREHSPRPGVTWERELRRTEAVTNDDGQTDTSGPYGNQSQSPRPNRATRRAIKRANRKDSK